MRQYKFHWDKICNFYEGGNAGVLLPSFSVRRKCDFYSATGFAVTVNCRRIPDPMLICLAYFENKLHTLQINNRLVEISVECIPISGDEISHFENDLRLEEKSELTIRKYLRDVSAFIKHIGSTAITKETVIAFKTSLLEQGYKVRSINSMIASINALFTFLEHPELRKL